jgi:hypothetical protein
VARLFVTETRCPAQYTQPCRCSAREDTRARHLWSGPSGHRHQTCFRELSDNVSGVSGAFAAKSNSATSPGYRASMFVTETFLPAQAGHPLPCAVRDTTDTAQT